MLRVVIIPPTQRYAPHRLRLHLHSPQQPLPAFIPLGNEPCPPAPAVLIFASCRVFHLIANPARRRQFPSFLTLHNISTFHIPYRYPFPNHKLPSRKSCTSRQALDFASPPRNCMVSAEPADGLWIANKLHFPTQIHLPVLYSNMYLFCVYLHFSTYLSTCQ